MKKELLYLVNHNIITNKEDTDLSLIPSSIKRRLSELDKLAISLILKSYREDVDEIIFSSRYGELQRLDLIIEQYQTMNEVSPMQFSGSVHNYITGCFNLIKKINTVNFALSSGENSLSNGFIKALISKNKKILFCYADIFKDNTLGFSCIISKEEKEGMPVEFERGEFNLTSKEFISLNNFILNGSDFISPILKIRRLVG